MDQLAKALSKQELGRVVLDNTGLTGKYDFTLNFIGENSGPPTPDQIGPNIFRALQEQLGLRLESKKGMVDVLTIDHLEKNPTGN